MICLSEQEKITSAGLMTSGSSGEESLSRSGTSSPMDLGSSFPHGGSRRWHGELKSPSCRSYKSTCITLCIMVAHQMNT